MNKIRVYIFHTGKVRVDRAIPLHEKNPLALTGLFRGEKKKMVLPVSAYLIKHPRGNILIDTGWDTKYANAKPKQLFGMVNQVSSPIIKADEGIDTKLNSIGLSPKDIAHIFISHMDFDHVSGLRLVGGAADIRTSREEWKACNKFGFRYVDAWSGICEVKAFEYCESGVGPFGRSYDVFDDGSVLLVHTPGHSYGLFSVLINGADGYIVLGSDAAYLSESFTERIIPGFSVNDEWSKRSLDWLIKCKADPMCKGVFVNHDPEVNEQLLEVDYDGNA